jgi:hypothetical protein
MWVQLYVITARKLGVGGGWTTTATQHMVAAGSAVVCDVGHQTGLRQRGR